MTPITNGHADTKKKPFNIAIIGGGITGLTLAVALQRRGVPCGVYEQAPMFGEIGAGVGFGPNAVRALEICDPALQEGFYRVATKNIWPSKSHIWIEFVDGLMAGTEGGGGAYDEEATTTTEAELLCSIEAPPPGHNGAHRAHFLQQVEALLTPAVGKHFGKRLQRAYEDPETGKMRLEFRDGTTAEADAVVGCDGIKSRTREILFGDGHPATRCSYTHKYAYRGLIPMEDALPILGEERALNISAWTGLGKHVLSFPVNYGKTLNVVAFMGSNKNWPSEDRLTLPATREEALHDFQEFNPKVRRLLGLLKTEPDKWAIFDLAEHPAPTFYKGRISLLGDAAHASSPHHGAGAGFGIEDCAVLASLLADDSVRGTPNQLEAVFATYDACRRERDLWLVQSSRRAGDLYEGLIEEIGRNPEKMRRDIQERQEYIWNYDVADAINAAKGDLRKRLANMKA